MGSLTSPLDALPFAQPNLYHLDLQTPSEPSSHVPSPVLERPFLVNPACREPQVEVLGSEPAPLPFDSVPGRLPVSSPADEQPHGRLPLSSSLPPPPSGPEALTAFAEAIPRSFSLLTPPEPLRRPPLSLPSFEMLGIAIPHPDKISSGLSQSMPSITEPFPPLDNCGSPNPGAGSDESVREMPDQASGSDESSSMSKSAGVVPARRISILTPPPEELPDFDWGAPAEGYSSSGLPADASRANPKPDVSHEQARAGAVAHPPAAAVEGRRRNRPISWLDPVNNVITSTIEAERSSSSVKILSHALPSPSIPGHAFPKIIEDIRSSLPPSPLTWISLLHAVPNRFNLSDLPTSPPTTPGLPHDEGEDYFTTKIFESVTAALNYEEARSVIAARQVLQPPGSIDLAIVERYIPPATRNEFASLFDPRAPSLLVDRLVELVPKSGSLVFVYPTKTGAQTFTTKYLGPVLDPILRSLVVINNFSTYLSSQLGQMTAVEQMYEFDEMHERTLGLCEQLSSGNAHRFSRLNGVSGQYTLAYAAKHEVQLEREVWASWWIKQEKQRIRTSITEYYRNAGRMNAKSEVMPQHLIQEILEGVESRNPEYQPAEKIEVAVLVIRRDA